MDEVIVRARPYLEPEDLAGLATAKECPESPLEQWPTGSLNSPTVFLNQGREGLWLALKLEKVCNGDEVVVPAITCPGFLRPIQASGALPVVADVEGRDGALNVDVESVEKVITPKTKAVVVTHLLGIPADVQGIKDLCRNRGLILIEDCAHGTGANLNGISLGSFGDYVIESFAFDKPLSSFLGGALTIKNARKYNELLSVIKNEAGLCSDEDEELLIDRLTAELILTKPAFAGRTKGKTPSVKLLQMPVSKTYLQKAREGGWQQAGDYLLNVLKKESGLAFLRKVKGRLVHYFLPENEPQDIKPRMSGTLRKKLLFRQVNKVEEIREKRVKKAIQYSELLDETLFQIPDLTLLRHSHPVRMPVIFKGNGSKKELMEKINQNGYEITDSNYPGPVGPVLARTSSVRDLGTPFADNTCKRLLNLPTHSYATEEKISRICKLLNEYGNQNGH